MVADGTIKQHNGTDDIAANSLLKNSHYPMNASGGYAKYPPNKKAVQ